jgi:hypothetical protein
MSKTAHRVFITIFVIIVLLTLIALIYKGISYYRTSLEERFYHTENNQLKDKYNRVYLQIRKRF